jgi:transcription antitermination factor NusG
VHFGGRYAEVLDSDLAPLRVEWGPAEIRPVDPELQPGDRVRLSGTLFHGMEAEVLCLLPARQRIRVLLDLLGGPAPAEIAASEVVPVLSHPFAAA